MFDWLKERKYHQVIGLRETDNGYMKVDRKFVDEEAEVVEMMGYQTDMPPSPQYLNKHGKFVYFVDIEKDEPITFSKMEEKGLSVEEKDSLLNKGLIETFVQATSEDVGLGQKTLLLVGMSIGCGIGIGIAISIFGGL